MRIAITVSALMVAGASYPAPTQAAPMGKIRAYCEQLAPDDFLLQETCINEQVKAYNRLAAQKAQDAESAEMNDIFRDVAGDWARREKRAKPTTKQSECKFSGVPPIIFYSSTDPTFTFVKVGGSKPVVFVRGSGFSMFKTGGYEYLLASSGLEKRNLKSGRKTVHQGGCKPV